MTKTYIDISINLCQSQGLPGQKPRNPACLQNTMAAWPGRSLQKDPEEEEEAKLVLPTSWRRVFCHHPCSPALRGQPGGLSGEGATRVTCSPRLKVSQTSFPQLRMTRTFAPELSPHLWLHPPPTKAASWPWPPCFQEAQET
jgi:hypothetical protein